MNFVTKHAPGAASIARTRRPAVQRVTTVLRMPLLTDDILVAKRKAQRKFHSRDGCWEDKRPALGQEEKPEVQDPSREHEVLVEGAASISGKDEDITLVKQRAQAKGNKGVLT